MGKRRYNADIQLLQLVICFGDLTSCWLFVYPVMGDTPTMSKKRPQLRLSTGT
jgi:hypothetical protein